LGAFSCDCCSAVCLVLFCFLRCQVLFVLASIYVSGLNVGRDWMIFVFYAHLRENFSIQTNHDKLLQEAIVF
jgi:hypothetical protein